MGRQTDYTGAVLLALIITTVERHDFPGPLPQFVSIFCRLDPMDRRRVQPASQPHLRPQKPKLFGEERLLGRSDFHVTGLCEEDERVPSAFERSSNMTLPQDRCASDKSLVCIISPLGLVITGRGNRRGVSALYPHLPSVWRHSLAWIYTEMRKADLISVKNVPFVMSVESTSPMDPQLTTRVVPDPNEKRRPTVVFIDVYLAKSATAAWQASG